MAEEQPPPPPDPQLQLADNAYRTQLLAQTTEQLRKHLCLAKLAQLSATRAKCLANLSEQFYLEQNLNYLDFEKWRQSRAANPFVQNYIEKNYENHATIYQLEQSVCAKFDLSAPLIEQQTNTKSRSMAHTLSLTKLESDTGKSVSERAKHEAYVLKRIAELRKEGLWSLKRLPKLVEPGRPKTHWDYLLDEMSWMSTDFQQERKWKINCCRKISLAVQKHFRERQAKAELNEKEEAKRMRKHAQAVAREINLFWRNIEKIVKYKQNTLLEEKRKETMSLRLNMIVDQTEKYSSWLMESFNQQPVVASAGAAILAASEEKSHESSSRRESESGNDDDDEEEEEEETSSSDNESTIEAEEAAARKNGNEVDDEIEKLRLESELPLEALLKDYKIDEAYFSKPAPAAAKKSYSLAESVEDEDMPDEFSDDEDIASDELSDEEDDEATIEEEEERQQLMLQTSNNYNVQRELDELNADNSLSLEELLAKFAPKETTTASTIQPQQVFVGVNKQTEASKGKNKS